MYRFRVYLDNNMFPALSILRSFCGRGPQARRYSKLECFGANNLQRVKQWQYRTYASSSKEQDAKDVAKSKPKAATQLRRSASASLPIRANPTPTRSDIQQVFVLTTAERYNLAQLRRHLPSSAKSFHEAWWIPKWRANGEEGEVFIFQNGSFVCWGMGEVAAQEISSKLVDHPNVQYGRLGEPETEDVEFVIDPNENTRIQGDLIILGHAPKLNDAESLLPSSLPESAYPKDTLLARYSFSQALARSTALSALETSLDKYLSSVSLLPATLSKTGKPGLRRRELIMKLGELMKFRQGLNLNRENFSDTPDFYWSEPVLEEYFNTLSEALDTKQRTLSVNNKITYAAEVQSVLRELLTESSAHRMELIIIVLIAVEVVVCLIRDGPELWHIFFPESFKEAKSREGIEH